MVKAAPQEDPKLAAEMDKEAAEHPWASKAVIRRIAQDHLAAEASQAAAQQAPAVPQAAPPQGIGAMAQAIRGK